MKILGKIGFGVSVIALLMGAYLQFFIAPAASSADVRMESSMSNDAYWGSLDMQMDQALKDAQVDFGMIVLFVGILSFLLCIIPAIKKQKIGIIGAILSLITLLIGAMYGTHMFS